MRNWGVGAAHFPWKKIRGPGGWPQHILIFNHIESKGYFISEKQREFRRGSVQRALENTKNPGGREQSRVSSQSTSTRGPFIFPGWWRRCISIRKRDGVGCLLSFQ